MIRSSQTGPANTGPINSRLESNANNTNNGGGSGNHHHHFIHHHNNQHHHHNQHTILLHPHQQQQPQLSHHHHSPQQQQSQSPSQQTQQQQGKYKRNVLEQIRNSLKPFANASDCGGHRSGQPQQSSSPLPLVPPPMVGSSINANYHHDNHAHHGYHGYHHQHNNNVHQSNNNNIYPQQSSIHGAKPLMNNNDHQPTATLLNDGNRQQKIKRVLETGGSEVRLDCYVCYCY